MNEGAKDLIEFCKGRGIKRLRLNDFSVEFYPDALEPMNLDPKNLAKVLGDTIPPDSEMLFASSEGLPEHEKPINPSEGTADNAP